MLISVGVHRSHSFRIGGQQLFCDHAINRDLFIARVFCEEDALKRAGPGSASVQSQFSLEKGFCMFLPERRGVQGAFA